MQIISLFFPFYTFPNKKNIYYFMKIYFLSSMPCELTLNGVFFGITDNFERFAEINLSDRVFAKFTPEGKLPIGFFITEELLSAPPLGCEVYIIKEGVAVFARDFPPADFTLRPIAQERFGSCLVSVFQQGNVQLSLETEHGFFVSHLPPSFSVCTLSMHADLCFIEGQNFLAIYTKRGKCVFLEQILDFEVHKNELNATMPLSDALNRVAKCRYLLEENGCERTAFSIHQARAQDGDFSLEKIQNELLPFAFFESVLIGANYAEFLCDSLKEKADGIRAFLGDFVAVTLTKEPHTCGLVRHKAERLFEVAYFTVETNDGKITDITG